ncbi:MAG TPA: hypothetical protein VK116_20145, partial [Planctomycetota bacterium]|nr:hypothetical protein [Planctomycetota bacterium]
DRWRPSDIVLGTPGEDDTPGTMDGGLQRIGDANQDSAVDLSDPIELLRRLFLGVASPLPCEGDDLSSGGNRVLLDPNGDERVDLSDAVYLLDYLFLGGTPPTLGPDCVRVAGCPDACSS